jgi:hypothetical protein
MPPRPDSCSCPGVPARPIISAQVPVHGGALDAELVGDLLHGVAALGVMASRDTLIRLIRALPDPEIGQITYLLPSRSGPPDRLGSPRVRDTRDRDQTGRQLRLDSGRTGLPMAERSVSPFRPLHERAGLGSNPPSPSGEFSGWNRNAVGRVR